MAKKGRPVCENPRSVRCIFRLTDSESSRLNDICKMSGMGRSDVMRTALERMFEEEKFKEEHPLSPLLDKRIDCK